MAQVQVVGSGMVAGGLAHFVNHLDWEHDHHHTFHPGLYEHVFARLASYYGAHSECDQYISLIFILQVTFFSI
jgi:hypothetical protein